MKREEITAEILHSYFEYADGKLIWKVSRGKRAKGSIAGRKVKEGYRQVCFDYTRLLEHQAIFMMFNGYIPKELDHINRIVDDNRIENLRPITRSENLKNRKKWKVNKHGKNQSSIGIRPGSAG